MVITKDSRRCARLERKRLLGRYFNHTHMYIIKERQSSSVSKTQWSSSPICELHRQMQSLEMSKQEVMRQCLQRNRQQCQWDLVLFGSEVWNPLFRDVMRLDFVDEVARQLHSPTPSRCPRAQQRLAGWRGFPSEKNTKGWCTYMEKLSMEFVFFYIFDP